MNHYQNLRNQADKVSVLAYLSEPALACLASVLDLTNASGTGLAIAVGATVASTMMNIGNQIAQKNFNSGGVLEEYMDAFGEAIMRTRENYKNSAKKTKLIDLLEEELYDFDLDLSATIVQTSQIQDKFRDNVDVQAIIMVFNTHFKIVAAKYPSLRQYLLLNTGTTIMETMKRVEFLQQSNGKKIDEVLSGVQIIERKITNIGSDVRDVKQGIHNFQKDWQFVKNKISNALEMCFNGLLVFLVFMIIDYFNPSLENERLQFCIITIIAEAIVSFVRVRDREIRKARLKDILTHTSVITVTTLFVYRLDHNWLIIGTIKVLVAVAVRYSWELFLRYKEAFANRRQTNK